MSQSKLRQVLTAFENADSPLSVPQIAQDLHVSQERLDGMIQHWVRRGKIREITGLTDCSTCGESGSCAFVMEMPRTYELARDSGVMPVNLINVSCGCKG